MFKNEIAVQLDNVLFHLVVKHAFKKSLTHLNCLDL